MTTGRFALFMTGLERFDMLLRAVTGLKKEASPSKLTVFAVRNVAAVQRQLGSGGTNVAGFYAPTIADSIAVIPEVSGNGQKFDMDPQTVLFHEYTHHFTPQYFPVRYPAWYVEGFAEYMSTTRFTDNGSVAVGLPAQHRFYGLALDKAFLVTRMFASDLGAMSGEQTDAFNSWSWLLTHYLPHVPARRGYSRTMRLYADGTPPQEAAVAAFGDIAALQSDLFKYRRVKSFTDLRMAGSKSVVAVPGTTPVASGATTLVPLMLRFRRGSRPAEIGGLVADARRPTMQRASDPRCLEMLTEGELDVSQWDAATATNDRLLALRPTGARGLLRRARIAKGRPGMNDEAAQWAH